MLHVSLAARSSPASICMQALLSQDPFLPSRCTRLGQNLT